jgi:ATP-dependent Lhr-like helicase
MRDIYVAHDVLPFLDPTAQRFLGEGREAFATLALADRLLLDQGSQTILLTWLGDAANEAIACILISRGVQASAGQLGVEIQRVGRSLEEVEGLLGDICSEPTAPVDELLAKAGNLVRQKWDGLLSPRLLGQSYASSNLDLDEALDWLRTTFESRPYQISSGV